MNGTQNELVKVIHKLRLFGGLELPEMQRLLPSGGVGNASTSVGGPVRTCAGRRVCP